MAGSRKFRGQPLQVVCTEEMRAKIDEIATGEEISVARVIREALDGQGLEARYVEHQRRMGITPKPAADAPPVVFA